MKKKLIIFVLCIILLLSFNVSIFAQSSQRLSDDADILTDAEETELLISLNEYSEKYCFEIMILTTDTLTFSKPTDTTFYDENELDDLVLNYAENYYRSCGFSYKHDGVIFVRYINDYDVYMRMVSFGSLRNVFDDPACDNIIDSIEDYIVRGSSNVALGFNKYLEKVENVYLSRDSLTLQSVIVALLIALVIALIIVMSMKGKLKSVRSQAYAGNYLKKDSFKLTNSNDIYLYRTVTKTRIQNNSSNGRSGGSHGGGGGGGRRS